MDHDVLIDGQPYWLTPSPAARGVSVKAYGAVGDGVHDDTAAIQAAVTIADQAGTIAALRAVLAPLLDDPWECITFDEARRAAGQPLMSCRFCGHDSWDEAHNPDCPVLRKNELLGR